MRKINEILAVALLSLAIGLSAAVGLHLCDTGILYQKAAFTKAQQREILARNKQANARVLEMRREIQGLSENEGDKARLGRLIAEIEADVELPAMALQEAEEGGMSGALPEETQSLSGNAAISGNDSVSGNEGVSENSALLENETLSENDAIGGMPETETESENGAISGDKIMSSEQEMPPRDSVLPGNESISENDTISGNGTVPSNETLSENNAVSENSTVSGNESLSENSTVSGNGTVSGNSPQMSLEERRKIRSSMEETQLVNTADLLRLAQWQTDFSEMKIACLGDSITAATNLEGKEGYPASAYPSVLKSLLGAKEVYNLGIGGSAIGRYWSKPFVERYQEIPADADIILVMGGANDSFCLSEQEFGSLKERRPWTFCGDLDELMRGLGERYPEAEVFFVTPLPNVLQDYLMRERSYLLPQKRLVDVILTLAAEYGFPVIDLYNANILDSHDPDVVAAYLPDGVHGNEAGYRILAEHIAAELIRHYEQ